MVYEVMHKATGTTRGHIKICFNKEIKTETIYPHIDAQRAMKERKTGGEQRTGESN